MFRKVSRLFLIMIVWGTAVSHIWFTLSPVQAEPIANKAHKPLLDVYVSGTISQSTTWTSADSPYVVIGDVTIPSGVTLTLEPGTIVKFDTDKQLNIYGTFLAEGTVGNEIIFTSLKDDSVGGDTNGDGNATAPAPGDWSRIYISSGGHATLAHTSIRYGGGGGVGSVIYFTIDNPTLNLSDSIVSDNLTSGLYAWHQSVQITITNSVFENNGVSGIYLSNGTAYVQGSAFKDNGSDGIKLEDGVMVLEGNTIENNGGNGIYTLSNSSASLTANNNIISNNSAHGVLIRPSNGIFVPVLTNNSLLNNGGNAIALDYDYGGGAPILSGNIVSGNDLNMAVFLTGNMRYDTTLFSHPGWPYVINDLNIILEGTVTVEPGTIFKFSDNSHLEIGVTFLAEGTVGNEIIFTSLKDDSVGGDTNGDGNATAPAPGDWSRISIWDEGQVTLSHTSIRYGGVNANGAISFSSGNLNLNLTDSVVSDNLSSGIYAWYQAVQITITNTIFENNGASGIYLSAGDITILSSMLANNNPNLNILGGTSFLQGNRFLNTADALPSQITLDTTLVDNDFSDSALRWLKVKGGAFTQSRSWSAQPGLEAYVVINNDIIVPTGMTWGIEEGVNIQFDFGRGIDIAGSLMVSGTTDAPVSFSSPQVFAYPLPGDWAGLNFAAGSSGVLHHANISFAQTGLSVAGTVSLIAK